MEKQIRKAVQMREDLPLEKIRQKHEDWKGTTMPERPQKVNLTRVEAGGTCLFLKGIGLARRGE